jgi:hypothetical protein
MCIAIARSRRPQANAGLEFGAISFGVGSYSPRSKQIGKTPE